MLYSLTLTWCSRSNISNVNISKMVRASAKVQKHKICRFQYLPSNDIIVNVILFDLDLLFQIVSCEIKFSDLLTYQSSVCVRCSLLRAPLSMLEPVVKDPHKQAIVTTSAIQFDNGIAYRFRYLNPEINFQFHVCTNNLFHDESSKSLELVTYRYTPIYVRLR